MGDGKLVGLTDAAKQTGLSREWLRKLFHRGELPGAQLVGNSIGIPEDEIERLKREPRKPRAGWPKGKPRKEPPAVSDFRYPMAGDVATHKLVAER